MHVRRSFIALLLAASVVPLAAISLSASPASAQDAQGADAGAPIASSATATATVTAPPAVTVTAPAVPTVIVPIREDAELMPLHLGRFLEVEAERARTQRFGSGALTMVAGGIDIAIGIGTFAFIDSSLAPNDPDRPVLTALSVIPIALGGAVFLGGLLSLFTPSPMEHLFEAYAPIAIDKNLSPAQRLGRGEGMLLAASESEHGRRVVGAVTSFVLAAIIAGVAIGIGVDSSDFPPPNNAILAASLAGVSVVSIVQAIGALWWERGPAEIAWEQWHSAHEPVVVQTSKVHFSPNFAPIRNGAVGGFSLVF